MHHIRGLFLAVGIAWAATLSGCVDRQAVDDGVVVTFAWWVKAGVLVGCVVAAFVGIRLSPTHLKWKVVSLGLAFVGGLIAVPGIWLDSARISKEGLRTQTGIWFAPRVVDVRFEDVKSVWLPKPETLSKHRTPITVKLHSGKSLSIPQGDLMTQCIEDLADAARAAKVLIVRVD
jgi:hypothetical protein